MISLLPYLQQSQGNPHLRISLVSDEDTVLEKTGYPFQAVNDSDPLTRLIEAHFVTDAGSSLRKVFLSVQRDHYLLKQETLWPLSNQDIEELWQKAFSLYKARGDPSFFMLSLQINEQGNLVPFQSLFYCKNKRLFFHPPCPKCGLPLHLCTQDDLLMNSGLQSYSHSLKRYLYCPLCISLGTDFYVYASDSSDPPSIKDRWALIKGFDNLIKIGVPDIQLPCIGCEGQQECYSQNQQVLTRITPFSFYPFYLSVFEAMSLNASDFLSLLSGASIEELKQQPGTKQETGRVNCLDEMRKNVLAGTPLLFDQTDQRHFAEVLYLKLSFLGEVVQLLFSETDLLKHPDLRISLDRIWVKLSEYHSLLPSFWNFRIRIFDMTMPLPPVPALPQQIPGPHTFLFLGLTWFYALLVNKNQDMNRVVLSLKAMIDSAASDTHFTFHNLSPEELQSTFLPMHIFWVPERNKVNENMNTLWERSLQLGFDLLKKGFQPDPQWSKQEFMEQLKNIRDEIKQYLLPVSIRKAVEADETTQAVTEQTDKAISSILMGIAGKWAATAEPEKEELQETVILSSGSSTAGKQSPAVREEKILQDDSLAETVIIGKGIDTSRPPHKVLPQERVLSRKGDETIQITQKPEPASPEDEVLSETVILRPENLKDKKKRQTDETTDILKRIRQRDQKNL
jgi:hypothetical protein